MSLILFFLFYFSEDVTLSHSLFVCFFKKKKKKLMSDQCLVVIAGIYLFIYLQLEVPIDLE